MAAVDTDREQLVVGLTVRPGRVDQAVSAAQEGDRRDRLAGRVKNRAPRNVGVAGRDLLYEDRERLPRVGRGVYVGHPAPVRRKGRRAVLLEGARAVARGVG